MKKSRHSEEKIIAAVKQVEAGRKAGEVAREMGVSEATIYTWKRHFQPSTVYPRHSQHRCFGVMLYDTSGSPAPYSTVTVVYYPIHENPGSSPVDNPVGFCPGGFSRRVRRSHARTGDRRPFRAAAQPRRFSAGRLHSRRHERWFSNSSPFRIRRKQRSD